MKKLLFFLCLAAALSGCATESEKLARLGQTIPKPNGFYEATGSHVNQETAMKIALASAEQTCIKRQKQYVVYEQSNSADDQLIDERVAKTADIIQTAASAAGRFIPGGNMLREKKYVTVTFKCE